MSANAPAPPTAVEEFVGTRIRDILAKRLREVSALLAFLRSVQGFMNREDQRTNDLSRLNPALEEAFDEVMGKVTTLDRRNWIQQFRTTLYRLSRLTYNNVYYLATYESDDEAEPRIHSDLVPLLFDVPVSVDGASEWNRIRDPEDSRHLFQGNTRFMTVLARCCSVIWQPETVGDMIAFYTPILETLESNFIDALTTDVVNLAMTEPTPLPTPRATARKPRNAHITALLSRMHALHGTT
jgi:hypothetical protein